MFVQRPAHKKHYLYKRCLPDLYITYRSAFVNNKHVIVVTQRSKDYFVGLQPCSCAVTINHMTNTGLFNNVNTYFS